MGFFTFALGLSAGVYLTKRMVLKNQQEQQQPLHQYNGEEKQSMWQQYVNKKKMENNSQSLLRNNEDNDNHSLLSISREFITRIRNENFPILEAQEKPTIDSLPSQLVTKNGLEKDS